MAESLPSFSFGQVVVGRLTVGLPASCCRCLVSSWWLVFGSWWLTVGQSTVGLPASCCRCSVGRCSGRWWLVVGGWSIDVWATRFVLQVFGKVVSAFACGSGPPVEGGQGEAEPPLLLIRVEERQDKVSGWVGGQLTN